MATRLTIQILATAGMLALAACTSGEAQTSRSGTVGAPVTVGYVVAQASNVPIVQDLPGRVPAPISGRVGLSAFTEGALVTSGQTESLTTITRLDPVYVDIQQSAADLLSLRRSLAQGGVQPTTAQVRLLLPDGTDYGVTGTVEFSQVIVDTNTGAVTLRASFPNPNNILLPGMFVKARFAQAINTQAILVPQQALSRDPLGNATVWAVGPGHRP